MRPAELAAVTAHATWLAYTSGTVDNLLEVVAR